MMISWTSARTRTTTTACVRAFDHAHDAIVAASTREDWRRTCLLGIVVDMSVWNERVLQHDPRLASFVA